MINRGSEAVTISNIGLRAEDRAQRRDFEYDAIHDPERLPESRSGPLLLPVRLEGHGALRWIYGPQQLAEFRRGIEVRGYANIYRSFRWRSSALSERTIEGRRTEQIDDVH